MPWPLICVELGGSDSKSEDSSLDTTRGDESSGVSHPHKRSRGPTPRPTPNELVCARLSTFALDSLDNAADGHCFWYVLSDHTGIPVNVLRSKTACQMRENPALYDGLGDFEKYGGYDKYCDMVEFADVFLVLGNAEVTYFLDSESALPHPCHLPLPPQQSPPPRSAYSCSYTMYTTLNRTPSPKKTLPFFTD